MSVISVSEPDVRAMWFANKATKGRRKSKGHRTDQTNGTLEQSEVTAGWFLHRNDTCTILRLTSKNPRVDGAAVAEDKVCHTVDTLILPNAIYPKPLALAKEVRRAHPLHERPITYSNERNDPFCAKLQVNIIPPTKTPELLPPPSSRQRLKSIIV